MEKVTIIKDGQEYRPNEEYCNSVLKKVLDKHKIKGCFAGALSLDPPSDIMANNKAEAEAKLDRELKQIVDEAYEPDVMGRAACKECDDFDKCWTMKLVEAIQNLSLGA